MRKVIFLSKSTSEKDVEKEVRAMDDLCKDSHYNIIKIFEYGRLQHSTDLFVDMELCQINLDEYLQGSKTGVPGLIDWSASVEENQRPFLILAIFQQIIRGLDFIHRHGDVHCDLTPRKGRLVLSFD